jgi:hypothetical protein
MDAMDVLPIVGDVRRGVKAMGAVGEAARYAEAPIASAGLAIQRGKPQEALPDMFKSLKGERMAEIGDIPRAAGLPEPVSAATGLLSVMGMANPGGVGKTIGKLVTQPGQVAKEVGSEISSLGETAKRGIEFAKSNLQNFAKKNFKKMNRDWLVEQSQNTFKVADDTVGAIREEYGALYEGIGETEVKREVVKDVINDLVKGATKEEAEEIFANLRNNLGQEIKPNLNTVKKIKDLIQSDIPESVWAKGKKGMDLTPAQARKVKAYFKLKDITKKSLENTPDGEYLDYLDKKATDVYRLTKTIKRMVLDQTGQATETGRLVQAFSGKAGQAGKENLFYRLKELNENAQGIIENMGRFKTRQMLKQNIGKAAIGTGGILGIGELLRRIKD